MGIEVPLLFFFKDDSNFQKSGVATKQALLVLAYSTLFLSLSAAVSGLILANKLRKAPTQTPKEVLLDGESLASSRGYEGRQIWVARHCEYLYLSTFPTLLPQPTSQGFYLSSEALSFQSYKSSYTFGSRSRTPLGSPFPSLRYLPCYPQFSHCFLQEMANTVSLALDIAGDSFTHSTLYGLDIRQNGL